MKGIGFVLSAGVGIALQGAANAAIGRGLGTWQAAALTQLTGFVAALLLLMLLRGKSEGGAWGRLHEVKPVYRLGGALAAVIIAANIAAIGQVGATLSVAAVMIAQLLLTFVVDSLGWFGVDRKRPGLPQTAGIGLMLVGIVVLSW